MRLIIFEGLRGGWYWRLVAGNGRARAIGGEPFKNATNARRAFNDLHADLFHACSPTVPHKRARMTSAKKIPVQVLPRKRTQRARRTA